MSRPETPPSYIVDLNKVVKKVKENVIIESYTAFYGLAIDIVIPVYESLSSDTASRLIWLLDNKIYFSNKSRFVEYLWHEENEAETYYIYDKFKADSYSHKKSYKHLTFEVPYVDDTAEPIYIPVYWRVN